MRFLTSHGIALLALFVALGGTSYAVLKLPSNSVGTKQVKDHSLLRKDFKTSQLTALKGAKGAAGAAGPPGSPGAKGDTGATGPSEVLVKDIPDGSVDSSNTTAMGGPIQPGAGTYLVTARAELVNATSGPSSPQNLRCRLDTTATSGAASSNNFWLNALGQVGETVEAWAQRAVTLTAGDSSVSFICAGKFPAKFDYSRTQMVFQRVGALTTLP